MEIPIQTESTPTDWVTYRKSTNSIVRYGDFGQWTARLQLFPAFPIETPIGGFSIIGVNAQGKIPIRIKNGYKIILVGLDYTSEAAERVSNDCKVLHKFTLSNYGFIRDEDVKFYADQ